MGFGVVEIGEAEIVEETGRDHCPVSDRYLGKESSLQREAKIVVGSELAIVQKNGSASVLGRQFSLGSLLVLMTFAAVAFALFSQGGNWWLLGLLVVGDAVWFCVIAGSGTIENQQSTQLSQQAKDHTE